MIKNFCTRKGCSLRVCPALYSGIPHILGVSLRSFSMSFQKTRSGREADWIGLANYGKLMGTASF